MFCKFCGSPLPDGSKFCTGCGRQLSAPTTNQTSQNPSACSGTGTGSPTPPMQTTTNTTAGSSAPRRMKKTAATAKKGLAIKIGAAVVAAAVIGGVGGTILAHYLLADDTEEAPIPEEVAEVEEDLIEEEAEEIILETPEEVEEEAGEIIVEPIDPPTEVEMSDLFSAFTTFGCVGDIDSFAAGELTVDQAVVIAAMSLYGSDTWLEQYYANGGIVYDDIYYYDIIDYDVVKSCVQNLFGEELAAQIDSSSTEIIPSSLWGNENNNFPFVLHTEAGGDFMMYLSWDWGEDASGTTTVIQSISETDTDGVFEVEICYATLAETSYGVNSYTCLVQQSEDSDYGWIILSMEYSDSEDDYAWAALYASYLADRSNTEGTYCLIYLNDDMIPEVYYEGAYNADGYTIYYIDNGVVKTIESTYEPTYTVRGGYVYDAGGRQGYFWDCVYYLDSDGSLSILFDGTCEYDANTDTCSNYAINGGSVTQEEYESQLAAVTTWETDDSYTAVYLYDVMGFTGGSAFLNFLRNYS